MNRTIVYFCSVFLILPFGCESKKRTESEEATESENDNGSNVRTIEVKIREDLDNYSVSLFPKGADVSGFKLVIVERPATGSTEIVDESRGTIEFNPAKDFSGKVEIKAEVRKDDVIFQSVIIKIDVTPMPDLPVVKSQTVRLDEGQSIDVQLEMADADGDSIQLRISQAGTVGEVTIVDAAKGKIRYEAKGESSGRDEVTFVAKDSSGSESLPTKVVFLVGAVNDRPVATPVLSCATETRAEQAVLNAQDSDNKTLTFALDTNTKPALAYGRIAVFSSIGVSTYIPQAGFLGWDRYYFTASDEKESSEPTPVTVLIYRDQFSGTVGSALQGSLMTFNAQDPALGPLPAFRFEPVANRFGAFTFADGAVPTFSFTPNDEARAATVAMGFVTLSVRVTLGSLQKICPIQVSVAAGS